MAAQLRDVTTQADTYRIEYMLKAVLIGNRVVKWLEGRQLIEKRFDLRMRQIDNLLAMRHRVA